ncbi:MAG: CDGSH iron-sulfur domain-containing protein [Kofleriaceae bacterium]|nr:CDGSH iron-sulfur domain-containing protein [Kofleriaceae bacterium]
MKRTLPVIANNRPTKETLEKGKEYYFCTCGRSKNQPFCDGSHVGTSFSPLAFTAEESGDAFLCACKHTKNAPFCDGSHKAFTAEQVGQEGPGVSAE